MSQDATVFLETELVLENSLRGILPHKLQKGDLVLAKIVDTRDIAHYLSRLLGGRKDNKVIPLTVTIEKIETKEEQILVYTRFSPRVMGLTYLSFQDRVKLVKKAKKKWFRWFLDIFLKNKPCY